MSDLEQMGPKKAEHPSIGEECPACQTPFIEGDYTTLIALGPGDDAEQRAKAREGRAYNAVSVEVHWTCATGKPPREGPPHEWIGTFGFSQVHNGEQMKRRFVRIRAWSYDEAHAKMVERFGKKWAFLYANEDAAGVAEYHLTEYT